MYYRRHLAYFSSKLWSECYERRIEKMNQLKMVGKWFVILFVVFAIDHIFSLEYREGLGLAGVIYFMVWIIRNSVRMNRLTILGFSVLEVGYILILLVVKGFIHGSLFFKYLVYMVPIFSGVILASVGRHKEDAKKYPEKRLYITNGFFGCSIVIFGILIYLLT